MQQLGTLDIAKLHNDARADPHSEQSSVSIVVATITTDMLVNTTIASSQVLLSPRGPTAAVGSNSSSYCIANLF